MHIGTRIRHMRQSLGMSQSELAKRSGLSQSYISELENGKHVATFDNLKRIAVCLSLNPTEFLSDMFEREEIAFGEDTLRELDLLYQQHRYQEMIRTVNKCSGATYFSAVENYIRLIVWKAMAYNRLFKFDQAEKMCLELLGMMSSQIQLTTKCTIINELGKAQMNMGKHELALIQFQNAYELLRRTNERSLFVSVLQNLGTAHTYLKRYDDAANYLAQALILVEEDTSTNVKHMADVLYTLSSIHFMQGEHAEAIKLARDSLRHYEFVGDNVHQMEVLNNLGFASKLAGNEDDATEYYERAVAIAKQHPENVSPATRANLNKAGYSI